MDQLIFESLWYTLLGPIKTSSMLNATLCIVVQPAQEPVTIRVVVPGSWSILGKLVIY